MRMKAASFLRPGWKEGPNCWFMAMTMDLWITFWRRVNKGGETYTNACCAARLIVVDSARTRRIDRNAKTKPEQYWEAARERKSKLWPKVSRATTPHLKSDCSLATIIL